MNVYKLKNYSYVTVAEIAKDEVERLDFDICKQPRETPDAYYKRQTTKPDVIINAGFFNMADGSTIFSVINEQTVCSGNDLVREGLGIIGDRDLQFGAVSDKKWRDFMSAYPPLLADGKAVISNLGKEIDYNARRTAVGYNDTTLFIVCVDSPGVKFNVLRTIMKNLGCTYAVNFDGGGSTRMLVDGKRQTGLLSNRAVDSVFCVYLKKKQDTKSEETTKTVNYTTRIVKPTNIYAGPGQSYKVTGNLSAGVFTIVSETTTGWGKLKSGAGWLYLPDTSHGFEFPKTEKDVNYRITPTITLNVRSGPGTDYAVVTTVLTGVYTIVKESADGKWGKLKSGIGWIYLPYVHKV